MQLIDEEVNSVRSLVSMYRSLLKEGKCVELEVRIGTNAGRKFVPNVSEAHMQHCISLLLSNEKIHSSEWKGDLTSTPHPPSIPFSFHLQTPNPPPFPPSLIPQNCCIIFAFLARTEHHDFFYEHKGKYTRSRVFFDTDELTTMPTTLHKTRLKHVDCQCGLRVCLSEETECEDVPETANVSLVRLQRRRTFLWGDTDPNRCPWEYSCSMVWEGGTKQEAEQAQRGEKPTFQVEVELVKPERYIVSRSDETVARSLIMKGLDLLSPRQQSGQRPH